MFFHERFWRQMSALPPDVFESALARLHVRPEGMGEEVREALSLIYYFKVRGSVILRLRRKDFEFKGSKTVFVSLPQWGFRPAQKVRFVIPSEVLQRVAMRFGLLGGFPELSRFKNPRRVLWRASKRLLQSL